MTGWRVCGPPTRCGRSPTYVRSGWAAHSVRPPLCATSGADPFRASQPAPRARAGRGRWAADCRARAHIPRRRPTRPATRPVTSRSSMSRSRPPRRVSGMPKRLVIAAPGGPRLAVVDEQGDGVEQLAVRGRARPKPPQAALVWALSWISALIERDASARSSVDRADGFGPSGRGFESCRARHPLLYLRGKPRLTRPSCHRRWHAWRAALGHGSALPDRPPLRPTCPAHPGSRILLDGFTAARWSDAHRRPRSRCVPVRTLASVLVIAAGMPARLRYHAGMARQLTVRGVPDEVVTRLEQVSRARGRSVNVTVNEILAQAVGAHERRRRLERSATWTAEDLEEVSKAVAEQRTLDDRLWR